MTALTLCVNAAAWPAEDFIYPASKKIRDPFVPSDRGSGVHVPSAPSPDSKQKEFSIVLEGIVWDSEEPLAIINGNIKARGERIGDFILHTIEPERIVLRKGDSQNIIELNQTEKGE